MTDNDKENGKVNVGLIQRLFDQLEKAMSKVDDGMGNLSLVIADMLEILKHSTTNDEIITKLEAHSKRVGPTVGVVEQIYTKCEQHGDNVNSIKTHLSKLTGWVKWMIAVVGIAFTLMTVTYLFTTSSIDNMVKSEVAKSSIISHQSTKANLEMEELMTEVKYLRKELHKHESD